MRSKGTYVLAPMIDSLNHKSTVPTDLDYDSLRQRFRLRLGQGYKAGEQVCAWVWVGLVDVAACVVWCGVTLPVRCTRLAHSNPIQTPKPQVLMSYGAKSNDDLVMYYGFVEPDSPADVFEFGDMLAWLKQRRSGVVNDDRVQTMYSKGLQDAVRCVLSIVCRRVEGNDGRNW